MIQKALSDLLDRVLGKFIYGLNDEHISLSDLLSGKLELTNIHLKQSAIDLLDIPCRLNFGCIGYFKINLPIFYFMKSPINVYIEDVIIVLSTIPSKFWDDKLFKEKYIVNKKELLLSSEYRAIVCSVEGGVIWQMLLTFINNINISIKNIQIRIEDFTSNPSNCFSIGISIDELLISLPKEGLLFHRDGYYTKKNKLVSNTMTNMIILKNLGFYIDPLNMRKIINDKNYETETYFDENNYKQDIFEDLTNSQKDKKKNFKKKKKDKKKKTKKNVACKNEEINKHSTKKKIKSNEENLKDFQEVLKNLKEKVGEKGNSEFTYSSEKKISLAEKLAKLVEKNKKKMTKKTKEKEKEKEKELPSENKQKDNTIQKEKCAKEDVCECKNNLYAFYPFYKKNDKYVPINDQSVGIANDVSWISCIMKFSEPLENSYIKKKKEELKNKTRKSKHKHESDNRNYASNKVKDNTPEDKMMNSNNRSNYFNKAANLFSINSFTSLLSKNYLKKQKETSRSDTSVTPSKKKRKKNIYLENYKNTENNHFLNDGYYSSKEYFSDYYNCDNENNNINNNSNNSNSDATNFQNIHDLKRVLNLKPHKEQNEEFYDVIEDKNHINNVLYASNFVGKNEKIYLNFVKDTKFEKKTKQKNENEKKNSDGNIDFVNYYEECLNVCDKKKNETLEKKRILSNLTENEVKKKIRTDKKKKLNSIYLIFEKTYKINKAKLNSFFLFLQLIKNIKHEYIINPNTFEGHGEIYLSLIPTDHGEFSFSRCFSSWGRQKRSPEEYNECLPKLSVFITLKNLHIIFSDQQFLNSIKWVNLHYMIYANWKKGVLSQFEKCKVTYEEEVTYINKWILKLLDEHHTEEEKIEIQEYCEEFENQHSIYIIHLLRSKAFCKLQELKKEIELNQCESKENKKNNIKETSLSHYILNRDKKDTYMDANETKQKPYKNTLDNTKTTNANIVLNNEVKKVANESIYFLKNLIKDQKIYKKIKSSFREKTFTIDFCLDICIINSEILLTIENYQIINDRKINFVKTYALLMQCLHYHNQISNTQELKQSMDVELYSLTLLLVRRNLDNKYAQPELSVLFILPRGTQKIDSDKNLQKLLFNKNNWEFLKNYDLIRNHRENDRNQESNYGKEKKDNGTEDKEFNKIIEQYNATMNFENLKKKFKFLPEDNIFSIKKRNSPLCHEFNEIEACNPSLYLRYDNQLYRILEKPDHKLFVHKCVDSILNINTEIVKNFIDDIFYFTDIRSVLLKNKIKHNISFNKMDYFLELGTQYCNAILEKNSIHNSAFVDIQLENKLSIIITKSGKNTEIQGYNISIYPIKVLTLLNSRLKSYEMCTTDDLYDSFFIHFNGIKMKRILNWPQAAKYYEMYLGVDFMKPYYAFFDTPQEHFLRGDELHSLNKKELKSGEEENNETLKHNKSLLRNFFTMNNATKFNKKIKTNNKNKEKKKRNIAKKQKLENETKLRSLSCPSVKKGNYSESSKISQYSSSVKLFYKDFDKNSAINSREEEQMCKAFMCNPSNVCKKKEENINEEEDFYKSNQLQWINNEHYNIPKKYCIDNVSMKYNMGKARNKNDPQAILSMSPNSTYSFKFCHIKFNPMYPMLLINVEQENVYINICDYDIEFFFHIFADIYEHYIQKELAHRRKKIAFLINKIQNYIDTKNKYTMVYAKQSKGKKYKKQKDTRSRNTCPYINRTTIPVHAKEYENKECNLERFKEIEETEIQQFSFNNENSTNSQPKNKASRNEANKNIWKKSFALEEEIKTKQQNNEKIFEPEIPKSHIKMKRNRTFTFQEDNSCSFSKRNRMLDCMNCFNSEACSQNKKDNIDKTIQNDSYKEYKNTKKGKEKYTLMNCENAIFQLESNLVKKQVKEKTNISKTLSKINERNSNASHKVLKKHIKINENYPLISSFRSRKKSKKELPIIKTIHKNRKKNINNSTTSSSDVLLNNMHKKEHKIRKRKRKKKNQDNDIDFESIVSNDSWVELFENYESDVSLDAAEKQDVQHILIDIKNIKNKIMKNDYALTCNFTFKIKKVLIRFWKRKSPVTKIKTYDSLKRSNTFIDLQNLKSEVSNIKRCKKEKKSIFKEKRKLSKSTNKKKKILNYFLKNQSDLIDMKEPKMKTRNTDEWNHMNDVNALKRENKDIHLLKKSSSTYCYGKEKKNDNFPPKNMIILNDNLQNNMFNDMQSAFPLYNIKFTNIKTFAKVGKQGCIYASYSIDTIDVHDETNISLISMASIYHSDIRVKPKTKRNNLEYLKNILPAQHSIDTERSDNLQTTNHLNSIIDDKISEKEKKYHQQKRQNNKNRLIFVENRDQVFCSTDTYINANEENDEKEMSKRFNKDKLGYQKNDKKKHKYFIETKQSFMNHCNTRLDIPDMQNTHLILIYNGILFKNNHSFKFILNKAKIKILWEIIDEFAVWFLDIIDLLPKVHTLAEDINNNLEKNENKHLNTLIKMQKIKEKEYDYENENSNTDFLFKNVWKIPYSILCDPQNWNTFSYDNDDTMSENYQKTYYEYFLGEEEIKSPNFFYVTNQCSYLKENVVADKKKKLKEIENTSPSFSQNVNQVKALIKDIMYYENYFFNHVFSNINQIKCIDEELCEKTLKKMKYTSLNSYSDHTNATQSSISDSYSEYSICYDNETIFTKKMLFNDSNHNVKSETKIETFETKKNCANCCHMVNLNYNAYVNEMCKRKNYPYINIDIRFNSFEIWISLDPARIPQKRIANSIGDTSTTYYLKEKRKRKQKKKRDNENSCIREEIPIFDSDKEMGCDIKENQKEARNKENRGKGKYKKFRTKLKYYKKTHIEKPYVLATKGFYKLNLSFLMYDKNKKQVDDKLYSNKKEKKMNLSKTKTSVTGRIEFQNKKDILEEKITETLKYSYLNKFVEVEDILKTQFLHWFTSLSDYLPFILDIKFIISQMTSVICKPVSKNPFLCAYIDWGNIPHYRILLQPYRANINFEIKLPCFEKLIKRIMGISEVTGEQILKKQKKIFKKENEEINILLNFEPLIFNIDSNSITLLNQLYNIIFDFYNYFYKLYTLKNKYEENELCLFNSGNDLSYDDKMKYCMTNETLYQTVNECLQIYKDNISTDLNSNFTYNISSCSKNVSNTSLSQNMFPLSHDHRGKRNLKECVEWKQKKDLSSMLNETEQSLSSNQKNMKKERNDSLNVQYNERETPNLCLTAHSDMNFQNEDEELNQILIKHMIVNMLQNIKVNFDLKYDIIIFQIWDSNTAYNRCSFNFVIEYFTLHFYTLNIYEESLGNEMMKLFDRDRSSTFKDKSERENEELDNYDKLDEMNSTSISTYSNKKNFNEKEKYIFNINKSPLTFANKKTDNKIAKTRKKTYKYDNNDHVKESLQDISFDMNNTIASYNEQNWKNDISIYNGMEKEDKHSQQTQKEKQTKDKKKTTFTNKYEANKYTHNMRTKNEKKKKKREKIKEYCEVFSIKIYFGRM